ncbi:hypothetical protein GWC77_17440 [Paraburkholderia sp. NMBU_R16]|uniref:hypothetical protein n=1 Tax=Paraburkholderia sp. NMBU_R16 TaxID=2698676 RepID=UPI001566DC54|nr:hypothetical protein [Paraburkholderia sp. NMBU_R16]NRO97707.1 hypothetical protein [Paraburkholderia sp. NMBU_R16]
MKPTTAKDQITMSTPNNYITPSDFLAWEKVNAAMLRDEAERQRRAIDDAVIKAVMQARQSGMCLQDAGRIIVRNFQYGCRDGISYTPAAVRRALESIGWEPKRKNAGGDAQ